MNQDTDKKFCSILFEVMEARGVRDLVCSPDSRNVPLLIAASERKGLRKHFVSDTRSAAFMALGMALVSKNPVALVCTSGTALLNYSPAVAEAFYQGIPLIVISADQPGKWIDQDDSQTLRQSGALDNFVKKCFNFPSLGDENEEMQWYVARMANEAFITAESGKKGPVHINFPLAEPLMERASLTSKVSLIENIQADTIGNKELFKKWAQQLIHSKVMLVAGFQQPNAYLQKEISDFCRFPNVAVMAETISNLHLKPEAYMVDSVLTAFQPELLDELAPDIVISIGGALVSDKLKEYLRRNSNSLEHWAVGYSSSLADPFFSLSKRFEIEPSRFFKSLNSALRRIMRQKQPDFQYREAWADKKKQGAKVKGDFVRECEWSELKALDLILNSLPSEYNLFLSNDTTIKYARILPHSLPHATYCNPGLSGIDGNVSTAIGGAIAYKGLSLLITGDLSMAYDIGALNINEAPGRMKIIVIDNQEGGIFRFFPSTSSLEIREEHLCQDPLVPVRELAQGFGWNFVEVYDEKTLLQSLPGFLIDDKRNMMIVRCPGEKSVEILKQYMKIKVR